MAQLGWKIFVPVLQRAEHDRASLAATRVVDLNDEDDDDDDDDIDSDIGHRRLPCDCGRNDSWRDDPDNYCLNEDLGTVWAAVQTELLTYRRLREEDQWISVNFDMQALHNNNQCPISVPVNLHAVQWGALPL